MQQQTNIAATNAANGMQPDDMCKVQANLARLLAEENLIVQFQNVKTAYMDMANRVIVMPIFSQKLSKEVVTMLCGHEVGHARYTPAEGWHNEVAPVQPSGKRRFNAVKKDYLNVLEDIRIERLIQRRYPGLRRDFVIGYRELVNLGFFGDCALLEHTANTLPLIDKINLLWKSSSYFWIDLADRVGEFYDRAKTTETWAEVVALASDIMEYEQANIKQTSKKESVDKAANEERNKEQRADDDLFDDNSSYEADESDEGDNQSDQTTQNDSNTPSEESTNDVDDNAVSVLDNNDKGDAEGEVSDEIPSSVTDSVFRASEQTLLGNSSVKQKTITFDIDKRGILPMSDLLVPYKSVLKHVNPNTDQEIAKTFNYVRSKHNGFVNNLARLFENKKRAWMFTRTGEHKTGTLNMAKAHQYRFNEDVFKKVLEVPKGKNHALVMYVDFSGSMNKIIKDVIDQVVALTMFCRRLNIPFRVYGFTTSGYQNKIDNPIPVDEVVRIRKEIDADKVKINNTNSDFVNIKVCPEFNKFLLVELFSDKMTSFEYATMVVAFTRDFSINMVCGHLFGMNYTPLTEAILTIPEVSATLKAAGVQKSVFIVLTDGYDSSEAFRSAIGYGEMSFYEPYKFKNELFVSIPRLSKLTSYIGRKYDILSVNKAVVSLVREITGDEILGYFIGDTKNAKTYFKSLSIINALGASPEHALAEFYNKGLYSIMNNGYSEFFVINQTFIRQTPPILAETNKRTVKGLSSAFVAAQEGNYNMREFVSRFVSRIT